MINEFKENEMFYIKNLEIVIEYTVYNCQYREAIYKLMNNSDPSIYIYPILSLIHQLIENELKMLILGTTNHKKTMKELRIENTHDLKLLIEREEFIIYYDEIDYFKEIFKQYKEVIMYFYEILGKYTFMNSRYPIEKDRNTITNKKQVDYIELYKNWSKYSVAASKIMEMTMAYSCSNVIFSLLDSGKCKKEISKVRDEILNESFLRK